MKVLIRGLAASLSVVAFCAAAPDESALMRAQSIPGMQVVIMDHGRVVTDAAYGVRDIDTQQPVDVHTRFEIGSITKQFTAAAILQLKERGSLTLDDRLGRYVPQYVEGRDITLRQLLNQVSGIPNYTDTPGFSALVTLRGTTVVLRHSGSFNAILALLRGKSLAFRPGTKWQYSNSNYVLLGRVVEVVSHMPWERYIDKNVFRPAGMTESSFMENEAQIPDMATGYVTYQGHLRPAGGPSGTFNGWAEGAGAIVSTATDLAKWDAALFAGKIIRVADLHAMTAPGRLPAGTPNMHYGFGWVIDHYDGQPRIWHNGGTLGFSSSNQIYPQQHEVIIALINTTAADADNVANATFDALHPRLAATQTATVAGEDPVVTARAKAIFAGLQSGTIDRTQFSDDMNARLTPALLAGVKTQFAPLGAPVGWVFRGKHSTGSQTTYVYRVSFGSGTVLYVYISIGSDGKVTGYLLSPQ